MNNSNTKQVIAFSLYGTNLMYYKGALMNSDLLPKIYPDWTIRIYYDNSVDPLFINVISRKPKVSVIPIINDVNVGIKGMYYRWHVARDNTVTRYIIRDIDSRFNIREKAAVDAWIESGKKYHLMYDHPMHKYTIQGGLFGGMYNSDIDFKALLKDAPFANYGDDERYLSEKLYPLIKDDCIIHNKSNWPKHNSYNHYVGQKVDILERYL